MNTTAALLWEMLEFRTPAILDVVRSLSESQVRWEPPNGANPVGWLLWHIAEVEDNSGLRALQVEALAKLARSQPDPVVIAGDLNLPPLSAAFHRHLSEYQDGFREAGWGFGHTFNSKYMPLRLDRILAGPEFRIIAFEVGCDDLSDHLCVVADIQRR